MSRAALVSSLDRALSAASPDLAAALDWLRSTDPALDLDDARLAEGSAAQALAWAREPSEQDWLDAHLAADEEMMDAEAEADYQWMCGPDGSGADRAHEWREWRP